MKVPSDGSLKPGYNCQAGPKYELASGLLETCFSRTNVYPLSLTLRCSERCPQFPTKFFDAISKFSQQYSRLQFALSPLLLTQILRRWSDIALSTSQPWTSIDPLVRTDMDIPQSKIDSACTLLEAWFHRTTGLSFFITLRCDGSAMLVGFFSSISKYSLPSVHLRYSKAPSPSFAPCQFKRRRLPVT